jgi:WD40 repeat protein
VDGSISVFGDFLFSRDGREMIFGSGVVREVETGRRLADAFENGLGGSWFSFSPDESRMVSLDGRGVVRFFDLKGKRLTGEHAVHQDHGRAAVFSPDGRLAATGAEDIILWDAERQEKIARLEHTAIVWSVVFSPDGRWVVSTHGDGSVLVWDVPGRAREANFSEHSGGVRAVTFSPDGRRVASAGEDRSVIVWDAAAGRKEAVFVGHRTRVTSLAFSRDGATLASGDQGGVISLWDVGRRELRRTLNYSGAQPEGGGPAYCVAFSPDGRLLAAVTQVGFSARPALALVPVDRGDAVRVAGSDGALSDRCSPCLAWAPAGDWVFFNRLGPGFGIGAYRLGHPPAARVPLDVPGSFPPSLQTL